MSNSKKWRAALLAGLSFAVLGSTAIASQANSVRWGFPAPTDNAIREPARKPKHEPAARKKTVSEPREARRPEAVFSGAIGSSPFVPFSSLYEPPGTGATRTPDRKSRKDRKEKKSAIIAPAGPVVPEGPLHVIVSVDAQTASLYANGKFVASTKVSTGTKSHPTPLGVFTVIQKRRHHISNLYGAPMPYMQRLTWSGTALHTGTLPGYPASHGCIRLTDDFAQFLWKATKLGARVIVTRDDVKPAEVSHTQLALTTNPVEPAPAATGTTDATVGTADATAIVSMSSSNLDIAAPPPIVSDPALEPGAPNKTTDTPDRKTRSPAPVSIFISRKDGKLYVRHDMQPLFDMPLKLRDPDRPLGTHVYTAMEMKDGAMRWTAVSIPSGFQRETVKVASAGKHRKATVSVAPTPEAPAPSATEALDRIDLPREALDRLAGLVIPGSSLIVSDNGLSHETGKFTDFIVLTR